MIDYIVDITIVSIVVFFALTGYISGLSKILSLITWGGSAALVFLYPYFDPWIASYIKNQLLSSALAFSGVFLLCLIVFSLLSSQLPIV